ncbi:phospholipase D4 isoform X3 [Enhydra lutris kenyoni]|uniref:Phospholipase D4 isoform X3 n=1 Tax=Enhydra lutris kenyoni TaxID=391180 RepID=A0A2Y9JJJ2_ENHLU|nr:phospholipase D4 isoform X3 [Enhydra lutris kenyoni]
MKAKAVPWEVLRVLAVLWLGAVALAYVLWQVYLPPTSGQLHPEEGPTSFPGQGSSRAWEPRRGEAAPQPQDACRLVLVESTPRDLPAAAGSPSAQPLAQAWLQLLDAAQHSIHVASFYWSLTGADIGVNDSSSQLGEALLWKLERLLDRNISLAVATNSPSLAKNSTDLRVLAARGAQVRFVPLRKLTGGVLHSKFWVVDGRHVYLGSANMDWRALTQVSPEGRETHQGLVRCPRSRGLVMSRAARGGTGWGVALVHGTGAGSGVWEACTAPALAPRTVVLPVGRRCSLCTRETCVPEGKAKHEKPAREGWQQTQPCRPSVAGQGRDERLLLGIFCFCGNKRGCCLDGEGAGRRHLQLQPPGPRPGEDLPDLLGAGGTKGCPPQSLASELLVPHQPLPASPGPL